MPLRAAGDVPSLSRLAGGTVESMSRFEDVRSVEVDTTNVAVPDCPFAACSRPLLFTAADENDAEGEGASTNSILRFNVTIAVGRRPVPAEVDDDDDDDDDDEEEDDVDGDGISNNRGGVFSSDMTTPLRTTPC